MLTLEGILSPHVVTGPDPERFNERTSRLEIVLQSVQLGLQSPLVFPLHSLGVVRRHAGNIAEQGYWRELTRERRLANVRP